MASSDKIVAINIGTQRVSAAVFGKTKKGALILNKFETRFLIVDPSSENMHAARIAATIAELVGSMKLAKTPAYYALPGQSVFIRFIKLPPIDDGDIAQLVKFEAQQQIPFPLDDVIWSYHMLPDSGLEKEAVLIAIKADLLNEIDGSITGAGLKTAGVDSAPSALYNAFRSSYPDLHESTLLIDIGSKTSNLIYAENGKFFTRSISMGGSSITSAIAREYSISFDEAEEMKISKGLVALTGGHTSSMDEDTSRLAACIRNALTRLVSEIPRTTNHYRSQYGGNPPKHILLAGGGAILSYTKEFIQERLQIPVQFFNPLHSVSIGKSINPDEVAKQAYIMGELIGLGLKAANTATINIDLVPTYVAKAREARKKLPVVIAGMALLAAAGGIFAWGATESAEKAQVRKVQEAAVVSKMESTQRKLDSLLKKEKAIDNQINMYYNLTNGRYAYTSLLKELADKAKSDNFWVVEFDPIVNYDPADGKGPEAITSTLIVKTFKTDKGLALNVQEEATTTANKNEKKVAPVVNAIRVKGLAKAKSDGSLDVAEWIRDRLKEDGENSSFTFEINGIPLDDQKIINYPNKQADKDAFAKEFIVILPLKNPIPVE